MIERCGVLLCVLPVGHRGLHRMTWRRRTICLEFMPLAKECCWRTVGHRGDHRTRTGLANYWRTA